MNDRPTAARGSRFFSGSAILIAALVVLSFPLTYFIPLMTGSKSFTLLRHLHGLAFFSWIFLYVIQTQLVRTSQVRLHRELGTASVALAGAMLPLGLWQAVTSASERQAAGAARPFEFSLYNFVDILVFNIAFGWAIYEATRRITVAQVRDVIVKTLSDAPQARHLPAYVLVHLSLVKAFPCRAG